MTLRQAAARHARQVLTRTDHFGERVIRRRKDAASLTVNVTIRRLGNRRTEDGVRAAFYRAQVFVPSGVDVRTGDELVFPMVLGGESTPNRVLELVLQDVDGSLWEVIR